jgi:hypothetical protein
MSLWTVAAMRVDAGATWSRMATTLSGSQTLSTPIAFIAFTARIVVRSGIMATSTLAFTISPAEASPLPEALARIFSATVSPIQAPSIGDMVFLGKEPVHPF